MHRMKKTSHKTPIPRLRTKATPEARMNELVIAGCDADALTKLLLTIKMWAAPHESHNRKPRTNAMVPTGMTGRTLRYMPGKIDRLAKEIENVNQHIFFDPKKWLSSRESTHQRAIPQDVMREFFIRLPEILRQYAAYVGARTTLVNSFRRGPGRGDVLKKQLILNLMCYVRDATAGRPFYDALAELLSDTLPDDPTYSADRLQKLASRYECPQSNFRTTRR